MAQQLQVATAGRRDGNVVQAEWDEMQSRMEPVLLCLNERATGPKFDKKGLSQLLGGLHQFMQNALGIQVSGRWRRDCLRHRHRRHRQETPPPLPLPPAPVLCPCCRHSTRPSCACLPTSCTTFRPTGRC